MTTPPELTPTAIAHLDGRDVHVRSSRRHGCCGGTAAIPTAEPGTPTSLDGLQHFDVDGTGVYVESDINPTDRPWTIDVDGFARWRRLIVVGLDLTTVADTPPSGTSRKQTPSRPLDTGAPATP